MTDDIERDALDWQKRYDDTSKRDADFETLSGIPLKPLYTPVDDNERDYDEAIGFPGEYPYTRGVYTSGHRGRLWTMRQFAGLRLGRRHQRALPLPDVAGTDRTVRRLRHAGAHGTRRRRSALARRGRTVRRRDLVAARHGDAVQGHPARRRVRVDDDLRSGRDVLLLLPRRRRAAGRPVRSTRRDVPDRHPQGVHRAEGVGVPAASAPATDGRHDGVLRRAHAAVPPDLGVRLPHPRSGIDGRAGARLHARGRVRLRRARSAARSRRRRLRPPALVLLQLAHRLLRGDREVPRGSPDLGALDEGAVRREGSEGDAVPVPRPDRGLLAHAAAARTTTSCGRRSRRWPGSSAARSRCTPTRWTRCTRCRPQKSVEIALRTQQIIAYETGVDERDRPARRLATSSSRSPTASRRRPRQYFKRIEKLGDGSMLEGCVRGIEDGFFQMEIAEAAYRQQKRFDAERQVHVGVNAFTGDGAVTSRSSCASDRRSRTRPSPSSSSYAPSETTPPRDKASGRAHRSQPRRGQPDPVHPRRDACLRDRRGDRPGDGRRVRPLPRNAALLAWIAPR